MGGLHVGMLGIVLLEVTLEVSCILSMLKEQYTSHSATRSYSLCVRCTEQYRTNYHTCMLF